MNLKVGSCLLTNHSIALATHKSIASSEVVFATHHNMNGENLTAENFENDNYDESMGLKFKKIDFILDFKHFNMRSQPL